MDLKSIFGIAKSRWWILVLVAVLAVVVTGRLAAYQEDNRVTHEAVTSVTFVEDPTNMERGDFEQFLSEQHILAEGANSDLLGLTPGPFLPWEMADIHLANDQNQIIFVGRGYSQEEANQVAQAMRDQYLAISTVGSGVQRISRELDELTVQISQLRTEISERQALEPPTEDETVEQTRRAALETRIGSLQAQYGALGVELMNPIERSAEAVQSEIDRVIDELIRLNLELTQIPAPVDPAAVETEDEQFLLDQLRLTQLETRWTQLYTSLAEIEGQASIGEVVAQEPTIAVTSGQMNQLLAFIGAIVVAMLALIAIERTRGIVWSKSEFEDGLPVIAELPPRQLRPFRRPSTEPWYITVPTGRRKAAVQLIRSQLDASQNIVVAFQGSGVFEGDTLDLTADVAMSAAVAGRNTLLVDATFSDKATQVEYGPSQSQQTLLGILGDLPDDPHSAFAEIKTTLVSLQNQQRNLWSLRCGAGSFDAGDVLASHRFDLLLDVARETFDLILIAGDSYDEPTSHILAQRSDAAILVGSIGHTVERQVEAAELDFRARRATLLGIVMLRRRRSRMKRWLVPRMRSGLWGSIDWLKSSKHEKLDATDTQTATGTRPSAVAASAPVITSGGFSNAEPEVIAEVRSDVESLTEQEPHDQSEYVAPTVDSPRSDLEVQTSPEPEVGHRSEIESAPEVEVEVEVEVDSQIEREVADETPEPDVGAVANRANGSRSIKSETGPARPAKGANNKPHAGSRTRKSGIRSADERAANATAEPPSDVVPATETGRAPRHVAKDSDLIWVPAARQEEETIELPAEEIPAAELVVGQATASVSSSKANGNGSGSADNRRLRDRLRSIREGTTVVTGFQETIERFNVSDPRNLSDPNDDAGGSVL